MKKLFLIAGIILTCGIYATLISGTQLLKDCNAVQPASAGLPDDVTAIVTNSCSPCHFEGGSGMATANVNFSDWDTYPAKKQAKKSGAICQAILDKSMPPSSVVKTNPEKAPTKDQAEIICKWAESLVYTK